ncbi:MULTISPECIES: preprotein translocase subunit SecE [Alcaligenaceae]|jgi:preprotein translocase subunit SecE|uniref:Protein translocase subunit SecE n=1 Tax=Neopusillimonas maritima TaxID=2026239 RepID=A0A3A1YRI7_9BURK|nr:MULTISPECIES: preprotein translocase subunit SecE [Alcaligenaceae]MAL01331.1 preprotein translocase subunit SecE [Alcaligenaceae bacterium]MBF24819.1 preprotein translocase subunit SecE [Pusillimonas sp.]QIM48303.1 preprotein translocase subunit SecE [Pusillimonas sp. DMV24BSW_D]RII81652.1 preprotein translocase subunit SecE [Neopusillimonas maritima]RIY39004.1 preprotein translocase subunit SecE [Neopusillimonas maritima]|tara:strand:+ start:305 stop:685 length:381 start_codon:yes stop_codon:yes gene_type:complete
MSNTNVETVTSIADRIKLALAVLVIIAGIVSFSVLSDQPAVVRVALFIASLIVAAGIAWMSEPGRRTISFGRDSYGELKRVVWPTRKEAMQMTGIVFVFVIIIGIFLWLADKALGWVIYGLLLGWR